MKVLYFHRTQGKGVEGVHIWGIVNALKTLGHEVIVVSPMGIQNDHLNNDQTQNYSSDKKSLFNVISQHFPEIIFELAEILHNFVAAKTYRKVTKKYSPELVYERYAIFSVAGMRLAKRLKIPFVLELNYTSCSPLVRKRSVLFKPLAKIFDRWLFRNATAIVVVSTFLRDHLVNDYGIKASKILICPNAADPEVFSLEIEPIDTIGTVSLADKKVVGFVGTFSPWHGLDLFIDAFRIVCKKVPDAVAVLIGDGPEKQAIVSKVYDYGLQNRVIFAGKISHEDLPYYIAAFDIGVMPDSNVYGSPMKIFEYMSMGKPVIVPDYGPLRDAVQHGYHGMIFKPRNRISLSECLIEVLSNKDLFVAMSRHAREHIVCKHNWLNNARNSLEFTLENDEKFIIQ